MGWLALATSGIGAAGAIVALWALWSREKAQRAADAARASAAKLTRDLATVAGQLDQAYANAARRDSQLEHLRSEINALEADLLHCSNPGDVRARARLFLQSAKRENP